MVSRTGERFLAFFDFFLLLPVPEDGMRTTPPAIESFVLSDTKDGVLEPAEMKE